MNFIARFNMPDYSVPVRAYLHSAGKEMWDANMSEAMILKNAGEHLVKTFDSIKNDLTSFDYVLAILWGQSNPGCGASLSNGNKMIDCFGYSNVGTTSKYWPGNPDVEGWQMSDGLFCLKDGIMPGSLTCEDATIILGKEAEYRRECKRLREFIYIPPKISGLENTILITIQNK